MKIDAFQNQLSDRLIAIDDQLHQLASLENNILNRKPAPDKWSVLECVEHLVRYNDFKPAVGQSYTIIDNDSNDAVTGTFNNLAEGATFTVDGYVFKISYVGGTGNDVVVTVQSVPTTPNTGFTMLTSHPLVTMLTTTLLAAGIAMIARRYSKMSAN